jgi:predicted TIM-barrel fold metal-dependent hydrolase
VDSPILRAWHEAALAHLPEGAEVWDAHTHTGGADPGGVATDTPALLGRLDAAGAAGAVMCTSADPGGYDAPNERVLADCVASGGRLVPFARIDPTTGGATDRARAALEAGHRGIKFHPRSEGFGMGHPEVNRVCAVAADAGAPVLVHAGRGMPPLGRPVIDLLDRHDGLTMVLAHGAISDLAWIAPEAAAHPGLLFDTSWWNPADLAALFAWVDASQILYASDTPYGDPIGSFGLTMRSALGAGLGAEALEAVFGGTLRRVLDGERPSGAMGRGRPAAPEAGMLRVASNLYAAIASTFAGRRGTQPLELALRALEAADPTPMQRTLTATLESARAAEGSEQLWLLITACSGAVTPEALPET